jgi:hypothetical protein
MWPHLFGTDQGDDIEQYEGRTLTQKIIGNNSLAFWFVCLIFLASFTPDIVSQWDELKSYKGFEDFLVSNWAKLLMRGISCISLFGILLISFRFIWYLKEDDGFERLFKIADKRSLIYWKNYTRARFVGVQQKDRIFSINQAMMTAGIPTVVVLVLIWISDQAVKAEFQPLNLLYIFLLVTVGSYTIAALFEKLYAVLFAKISNVSKRFIKSFSDPYTVAVLFTKLCDVLKRFIESFGGSGLQKPEPEKPNGRINSERSTQKFYHKVRDLFFPIKAQGILLSIIALFGSLIYLITLIFQDQSTVYIATTLSELCFWIIISYYIGIGAWSILEIPIYILKGVKKIPMNLDPLDSFKNLTVLERFSQTSIIGMVILFVLALSLSVCQAFTPEGQQSEWIVIWAQAAFIGLYAAIAIILNGPRWQLIQMVILYVLFQRGLGSATSPGLLTQLLPSLKYVPFSGLLPLYQFISLALFGLFSSYIFYLQFREINNVLNFLREKYKNQKLELYRWLINGIEIQLREVEYHSNRVEESANRQSLLGSINTLISIIDKLNREPVYVSSFKQITGVISPFMSAVILPLTINYMTQFIPRP